MDYPTVPDLEKFCRAKYGNEALEQAARICEDGEEFYQDDLAVSVCIRLATLIRALKTA